MGEKRKVGEKEVDKEKAEGQVMTPKLIARAIIKATGLFNHPFFGEDKEKEIKRVMEPSFGEGIFLYIIVARIIKEGRKTEQSNERIRQTILNSVYGIEKDAVLYRRAIVRLNNLLRKFSIEPVDWSNNLVCGDALLEYKKYIGQMDYVIGNPPYVKVHNMNFDSKNAINGFQFIEGTADLYIAFYEIGLEMLNDKGTLGFITPNSFLKNKSQQAFRDYLVENKYFKYLIDFKSEKAFPSAGAYTCICILSKESSQNRQMMSYAQPKFSDGKIVFVESQIPYEYLQSQLNKSLAFDTPENIEFLVQNKKFRHKFKDIASLRIGIATNKDKIYIQHIFEDEKLEKPYLGKHSDEKRIVYFRDIYNRIIPIESTILHRCVKASTYDGTMDDTHIIFPYVETDDGEYRPFTESELSSKFPYAYLYLCKYKEELLKRNMEQGREWFLFARSQGIKGSRQKKIVFSNTFKKGTGIKAYILDEDIIVYSRLFVVPASDIPIEKIKDIIEMPDFAKYCSIVGQDKQGGYVYTPERLIKEFGLA